MATSDERLRRRGRWEDRSSAILTIGSAVFLFAFSVLVLAPQLAAPWRALLIAVICVVWVAYIVDLCVRLALTPPGVRGRFLRSNWADAASVVLPLLRPFRLLKYLSRLPWFRGTSGDSVRSRFVAAALSFTVLFIYVIALAVLAVERDAPGATILTFGNAIWWACVTVATVGYGDFAPVTPAGRVLAIILMAGGLAIIGTASATIVSYLNERILQVRRQTDDTTGGKPDAGSGQE